MQQCRNKGHKGSPRVLHFMRKIENEGGAGFLCKSAVFFDGTYEPEHLKKDDETNVT
jgi:hypothetical protein